MNYKQLNNLNQLNDKTLIVGGDISKEFHVARAEDFRGIELGKSIKFDSDLEGFKQFEKWFKDIMESNDKDNIIIGMEPTGPYWLTLARWLIENGYKVVTVNPAATKKAKELDDNNQAKTDYRDARVIAQLVKDGRYTEPNLLKGFYEELREAMKIRKTINSDLVCCKNRIINWFDRYFPEYRKCGDWESVTMIWMLKTYRLPSVIAQLDADQVLEAIHQTHPKGIGKKKIEKIINVCKESVGVTEGTKTAVLEFDRLIRYYEGYSKDLDDINDYIEQLTSESREVKKITEIKGIGTVTASGIVSELGDISKYASPRQLSKMAGLSLTEDSSGKKKGQMIISRRGRSKLRHILYLAVMSLICHNEAFKDLYTYYTKRNINPLTGKQAIVALMNKLLRIIYALIVNDVEYDEEKMLSDIKHPENIIVVN